MRLALPLVVSTLSYAVMNFCDRLFLSWYSTVALGAVTSAAALNWTLFSLPLGVSSYATTFVAQYVGAGQTEKVGRIVWQSIRVGLYTIPVFLLIAILAPWLFTLFQHERGLWLHESIYFQTLALSSGAIVINAAFESFFIGRGKTAIVMWINVAATILNIVLDPIFIFGWFGLPELGIFGAGIATSLCIWIRTIWLAVLFFKSKEAEVYGIWIGRCFDWKLTRRLFRFGFPSGMQMVLEGFAVTFFVILIANYGTIAAAATSLAFSINMVAFVPIIGLGIGVSTIVGQKIGAGQPNLAARATYTALVLGLVYTSVFAVLYLFLPSVFLLTHAGSEIPNIDEVRKLTTVLLAFVAAYCIFDTVQLTFVNAIKGAGDTLFVLITTVISSFAFIVAGYVGSQFATSELGSIYWWWWSLTLWIFVLAAVYAARFFLGKWRRMNVIGRNDDGSIPSQSVDELVLQGSGSN